MLLRFHPCHIDISLHLQHKKFDGRFLCFTTLFRATFDTNLIEPTYNKLVVFQTAVSILFFHLELYVNFKRENLNLVSIFQQPRRQETYKQNSICKIIHRHLMIVLLFYFESTIKRYDGAAFHFFLQVACYHVSTFKHSSETFILFVHH